MNREEALELMHEYTPSDALRKHMYAVEAAMRAYARKFGEDEDRWGAAGLLHDADYEKWPEEHPSRIVARLRDLGHEEIAHAISAHYTKWNVPYDTLMSKALVATDELTGFTVACCLVRPEGIRTLTPKSVKKKFKDKAFAAKVERAEIERGLEIFGVAFADHVAFIIEALKPYGEELGIAGRPATEA